MFIGYKNVGDCCGNICVLLVATTDLYGIAGYIPRYQ